MKTVALPVAMGPSEQLRRIGTQRNQYREVLQPYHHKRHSTTKSVANVSAGFRLNLWPVRMRGSSPRGKSALLLNRWLNVTTSRTSFTIFSIIQPFHT